MRHLKEEYELGYHKVDEPGEANPTRKRPLSTMLLQPRAVGPWGAGWVFEIVSCVIAVGALVAIIVVLHTYDGKPMPDWPYGITLNALVSLLVTVMKAAMVYPITEGLSQLKWSWFNRQNKLNDLAVLDAASRGAVNAVFVLFRFLPRHLVTVGCFILVVAAAIAPFVQQVLSITSQPIHSPGQSSIRVCNTSAYVDYGEGAGPGMNKVPLSTAGAIYTGLFQSTGTNSQALTMTCPTGNCTFAPYQSLGLCQRCANITDELTLTTANPTSTMSTYHYNLTNGFSFSTSWGGIYLMNATTGLDLVKLDASALPPLILNFTAISAAGYGVPPTISATECALYFCVKTYSASVQEGVFNETLVSTATTSNSSTAASDITTDLTLFPDHCTSNQTAHCTYSVSWLSRLALANSITPLLTGSGSLFISNRPSWTSDTIQALYGVQGNYTDVSGVFTSLATALTTHARTEVCAAAVNGTTWTVDSFVHVQWPWLTLPIALVAMTLGFLVATVVRTRNQYIWKSSPLALLFSDVSLEAPHQMRRSPDLSAMVAASRSLEVLLETTEGGSRLRAVAR
ncbi:DUF3176 domain-containing protein [Aspergillus brunneoviolaceus CBS 621.78]|uniref:Uncharacterized protein n=1 Tax=Aspergillus brunneoviolaceus CBS 621.78 TaxID=1450534 RepID=A0ACD1GE87_9EURO|nr:hypothetical protein BO95DRAFT_493275 [Aspergillus brunneoviolaceus CBS 621.78]RAH47416.1 hypothetical protein BO95DRAFT_493275 [Aspergillus brunneoviolaceus CBS 621.78]